jgi:signal transduction histidine kinase
MGTSGRMVGALRRSVNVVAHPHVRDRIELERLAEGQAALRRVAMLVARGASSADVFPAVAHEVAQVLKLPIAAVFRYDEGAMMTVIAASSGRPHTLQPGTRWPLDSPTMAALVLETGRPARVEDYAPLTGTLAAAARESGLVRTAGAPILVDGRVWGVMAASSPDAPFADDVEDRLVEFTELLTTAIANDQAREERHRLGEEQAALRRVATLVAEGAPPAEVFQAVIAEVGRLVPADAAALSRYDTDDMLTIIGGWSRTDGYVPVGTRHAFGPGTLGRLVFETCRPGRISSYADASGSLADVVREEMGWRSAVGVPVVVEGRLWGVVAIASTTDRPLPLDAEGRLAEFTELVATAVANAESHEELTRLGEEQAALRRVATLVAEGALPADVFQAVTEEVGRLIPAEAAALTRYETDGTTVTALGGWARGGYDHVGTRFALEGTVSGLVFETRRSERIDDYAEEPGPAAAAAREMGWRSSVGAPITVEGRLWGALAVVSTNERPLPIDTERRLVEFTELVATAIANTESREELTRLAEEQAALRRVATLVAEGATPDKVFAAVAEEVAHLIDVPLAEMTRYDADGMATVLGSSGDALYPVGSRWPIEGSSITARVFETGRPARIDDYTLAAHGTIVDVARESNVRWAVGVPIVVDGALWGLMSAGSRDPEPLPGETEARLAKFTELVATAIANAEGREELAASRARIVATADATRRRIERDLHDGAQQQLVALALELRAAQTTVPHELGEHRAELARVVKGLNSVLDELREMALGIHPAVLAEGGLGPALKTLARRSSIPVELDLRAELRLPEPIEVAAYYVVSEALANTAKHARASVVHVTVESKDSMLRVSIRDDGIGGADPGRGSGLLGLQDRAEAIGGTVCLQSPPGDGTSLHLELPLDAYDE